MIPPGKVSVLRAAGWGAIAGAPALLLKTWVSGDAMPAEAAAFSGFLLGGMLLGALLFAIFAMIKNASAS
ncbi:hypothetical protein GCM10007276_29700 [Agaricicola taiwanensis]|uniref:Uncharacterized protein n=1 Tax=Agaricicola taiwanensis TaxID=591372 RepID=A0A8J2YLS4_9RHOB|nr:hypothetical protein [Agaricicola taiwanensis]GGE50705.1 hypothetical protein GCM10007276_29700 [Agaricicola taiwanensis]